MSRIEIRLGSHAAIEPFISILSVADLYHKAVSCMTSLPYTQFERIHITSLILCDYTTFSYTTFSFNIR